MHRGLIFSAAAYCDVTVVILQYKGYFYYPEYLAMFSN